MQLIKYKWDTNGVAGEPFLFARDKGKVTKMKLFDENLNIKIGKRRCTGFTRNGRHFECPKMRIVESEKMCRECALNDDFFLCMKCTGEECINESQRKSCQKNNYYIYLAAFSTMLKVGISYEHRILERLIEQGADMGAKIGMTQDGKIARSIEQKIRSELNICDRVTGAEKHNMLFGNPNIAAVNISNAFSKLKSNGLSQHLINPEIYNLQSIYRLSAVKFMPQVFTAEEGSCLDGNVVAAKGNIMVVKGGSGLLSVNAHRLVGCEIELSN
ncbi:MAG: DUF2797 domain-containing protein [Candidatus Aenigmatarchaeota archaeon]